MKNVIFDLDLTLVDTTCLEPARHSRNWNEAYRLIPQTRMYDGMNDVYEILSGLSESDYVAFPDEEVCVQGAPTTKTAQEGGNNQ